MGKLDIGLRQARRLCELDHPKRLQLLSEGLPIVFESAQGFLNGSDALADTHPRESEVLRGFAEEEAAKALLLIDLVRCPRRRAPALMGKLTRWFYDHLARLIYAEACNWKPMHVTQLQEYADTQRRRHYLEGEYGEYIMPNFPIFLRESRLYADIEAYEDGQLAWNAPAQSYSTGMLFKFQPAAYRVTDALSAVGAFSVDGLTIVHDVWAKLEFKDTQNFQDSQALTQEMLERLITANLTLERAEEGHIRALYNSWQLPMYNLDLSDIEVSLDELEQEREGLYPAW